jgi:hypothetical protein
MRFLRGWRVAGWRRWSIAFVVAAAVAALVSFSGTAVARGLVTGRQIKDGSLTSVDLKADRAVTGADLRDGTLTAAKLSSLPQGPPGVQGPPGPTGVSGLDNFDYRRTDAVPIGRGNDVAIDVPCATGTVVGGGASSASTEVRMEESRPIADGSGWRILVFNESAVDVDVFGWAVCVGAP